MNETKPEAELRSQRLPMKICNKVPEVSFKPLTAVCYGCDWLQRSQSSTERISMSICVFEAKSCVFETKEG